jgi:RNA polymerase sigma factor (sigma-70 family)
MARRYAFAKARLGHALRQAAIPESVVADVISGVRATSAGFEAWDLRRHPGCTAAKLRRIRRSYDELEELRNRYIEGALYLVLKSVHRFAGLGIDSADLVQEGNASLFQAVEGFDWTRDVRFKTYAEYWINQAFLKMLYNNVRTVRIPVWVQKALKKINTLRNRARHATGEELTSEQIGSALGMSAEKVDELLRTNRYAVSIDADLPGEDGGRIGDLLADGESRAVTELVEDVSLNERLSEVMADLPEREKLILTLRFGLGGREPYTLAQVGELLDVSAERIRQLQEAALRRLQIPRKLRRLETFAS